MSDQEDASTIERETVVKRLLKKAARRRRPSQVHSEVPHGRETDANREFATHREGNGVVWFFLFLPSFVIAWAICVKIGAI